MPSLTLFGLGKRGIVEFSPKATCSEIVDAWATSQGIAADDARGLAIIFRSKRCSPITPFVATGIPNNATLEVARLNDAPLGAPMSVMMNRPSSAMSTASASKSTGGTVRVALQLPSGALLQRIYGRETDQAEAVPTGQTRLQAHLPASTSLWDLLVSFEAQSSVNLTRLYDISGMFCMPVLVELQREFTGIAALRQTNLIKLGFGGGSSVLFRLDYRRSTLTDSDVQAALVEMNPTQAAVAVPPVVMPAAIATVAVKRAPNWLTVATDSARALLVECDAESSDSTLACLNTLSAILANLLKLPRQEAYRTLKPGNAVFQSRVGRWSQAVRFLNAIGFEAQQDSDVMLLVLSPNREPAYSELQTAAQFLKSLIDQRTAVPQLPVVETQQSDSIVEVSQSPDAGHESVSVVAIENMEIDADSSSSVPEKIETPTAVSLEQSSEMEVVAPESSPQTPCSSSAEVPISPIARPAMLVDEAKRTAAVEKLNSVLAAIRTEGAAALNAITALSGVCHNLLKQPDNTMFRQLNAENPKFIERIGSSAGAIRFLRDVLCFVGTDRACVTDVLNMNIDQLTGNPSDSEQVQMWVLPLSIAHSSAWLDRIGANLTRLRGEIEQSVRDQADAVPSNMDRELVLFAAEPKAAIALPSAHEDADDDEDQAALMTRIMAAHGQPSTYSSVLPSARDASTGQGDSALLRDVMKQQQQRREIEERMAHVPKSMREQMQQQMQPKYSKTLLHINCPNGRVLQCAFHPREKLADLFSWLASVLEPQALAHLTLVIPPALRVNQSSSEISQTFVSLGLVPAAKMQLKTSYDGEIFQPAILESYLQHRSQLSNAVASAMPSRISSATASIPLPADLSRLIANAPEVPQPAPAASEEISEEQAIEMEIERRARAMVGMGGANASAAKRPSWLK